jgi:hypothetical protein
MVLCSTNIHSSVADLIPHFTVDCYTDYDRPCGTLHIYEEVTYSGQRTLRVRAYEKPRSKVIEAEVC